MTKQNRKSGASLDTIRSRITNNEFGIPGERFMSIKGFAQTFSVGMDRAQEMFYTLREEGILMLKQKSHYLSHGIIPSDSSLGKMRKERKIVALLADHLVSYYIPAFADNAAAYLNKEGYQMMTCFVNEENCRHALRELYEMGVQGFLVLTEITLTRGICRLSYVPCATSGHDCTAVGADSVISGGSVQARRLVDMMQEGGCRRFLFVTPHRGDVLEGNAVYRTFLERLKEKGEVLEEDAVITEKELRNNPKVFGQRLSAGDGKTGVVCTNEQLSYLVMRCCDENQISVPGKVMLASFRTKSPMNQQNRNIITVEENIQREAAEAVRMILGRIRGDTSPARCITVEPKVINRLKEQEEAI